jgi:hypothetical protein
LSRVLGGSRHEWLDLAAQISTASRCMT